MQRKKLLHLWITHNTSGYNYAYILFPMFNPYMKQSLLLHMDLLLLNVSFIKNKEKEKVFGGVWGMLSIYVYTCLRESETTLRMEGPLPCSTIGTKQAQVLQHCIRIGMHYSDVRLGSLASQITSLTIVYSTVYSDADQRKHQSSASLVFVREIHRGPVNSPHKLPVTRKMFPFDDVLMIDLTERASHLTRENMNMLFSCSHNKVMQTQICILKENGLQW